MVTCTELMWAEHPPLQMAREEVLTGAGTLESIHPSLVGASGLHIKVNHEGLRQGRWQQGGHRVREKGQREQEGVREGRRWLREGRQKESVIV